MKNVILIVLLLAIALGVSGYIMSTQQKQNMSFVPTPTEAAVVATTTVALDQLKQGGSSYADPSGMYSFLYPADYKLDTQNNGKQTRLYKTGATQKGQTEMYDGVIIVFETIDLEGKTLEAWVDQNLKNSTSDGTMEIIEPKKQMTLNTYPGFSYKIRGLGESEYIVIQKDKNSKNAVMITTAIQDPKNIGFKSEVDATLSTLQILK